MSDNKEQKALHELASLFDIKYFEKKKEEQAKLKVFENFLKTEPKPVEEIEEQVQPVVEEVKNTVTVEIPSPEDQVSKTAHYIASQKKMNEAMYPTPIPQGDKDLTDALRKISYLEQWVSRIAATGPGSGEVNFRYLDDVDRSTIADGRWLKYDGASKKFVFDEINPYEVVYNTTEVTTSTYTVEDNDYYIGVNYAGPATITLPSTANSGRVLVIKDEDGDAETNPITVQGTVDNDAGGFIIQINNGSIQLIYRNGWRIV